MFKTKTLVIGAGLFGSAIARYLTIKGEEVLVVDEKNPMAASKCASGIYRPGWASKIQPQVDLSLPIIDQFAYVGTIPIFDMDKGVETSIPFIDCNDILLAPEGVLEASVRSATKNKTTNQITAVHLVDPSGVEFSIEVNNVVVAAGAYTNKVLGLLGVSTDLEIDAVWGATVHTRDIPKQNFIQNWAPYKQLYGLNLVKGGKSVGYFTMGTSVKNPPPGGDNRTLAGGEKLVNYAAAFKMKEIIEIPEGLRPFFSNKKDNDFVNRHCSNVWSATGGAKNGALLCGYAAKRIFEEIT